MSPSMVALHGAELDLAVLRHGRDAAGEAARQRDEQDLDGRGAVVLGREELGVVGVEPELAGRSCSSPRPKKPCAVVWLWVPCTQVLVTRHVELGAGGLGGERLARSSQELDVNAVVDGGRGRGHGGCSSDRAGPSAGCRPSHAPAAAAGAAGAARRLRRWARRHRRLTTTRHRPLATRSSGPADRRRVPLVLRADSTPSRRRGPLLHRSAAHAAHPCTPCGRVRPCLRRSLGTVPRSDGAGGACWLTWRPGSCPASAADVDRRAHRRRHRAAAARRHRRQVRLDARAGRHRRRALRAQAPAPRRRLDDARLRRPRVPAGRGVDLGAARRRAADDRPRRGRRGRRASAATAGAARCCCATSASTSSPRATPRCRSRTTASCSTTSPTCRPPSGAPTGTPDLLSLESRWSAFGPGWMAAEERLGLARRGAAHRARRVGALRRAGAGRRASRSSTACATTSTRSCAPCAQTPLTFLHGDWKLGNLGVAPGRTVLLDWTYPGIGPIAHDLAWYLSLNRARLPESKEDVDRRAARLARGPRHRHRRLVGAAGGAVPARRARAVRLGEGARRRRRARLVVRPRPGGGAPAVSIARRLLGHRRRLARRARARLRAAGRRARRGVPDPARRRAGRRRRRRHRRRQPRHRSGPADARSRLDLADGHARASTSGSGRRPSSPTRDASRSRPARARRSSRRSRFNHVPDPELALAEAARVVGPGGVVLASAYADGRHPPGEGRGRGRGRRARLDRRPVDRRAEGRRRCPCWPPPTGPWRSPRRAGLDATAEAVAVPFPDLGPADLVAWRLGMAQVAPFVASLPDGGSRAASRPAPSTSSAPTPSPSSAA